MDALILFFNQYGLPVGLIALAGIALLGVLKYCNVFKKFEEDVRHVLYLVISIGLSAIGSGIYLAVTGGFEAKAFVTLIAAIYALNQAFYSVFKNLSISEFFAKLLDAAIEKLGKKA